LEIDVDASIAAGFANRTDSATLRTRGCCRIWGRSGGGSTEDKTDSVAAQGGDQIRIGRAIGSGGEGVGAGIQLVGGKGHAGTGHGLGQGIRGSFVYLGIPNQGVVTDLNG